MASLGDHSPVEDVNLDARGRDLLEMTVITLAQSNESLTLHRQARRRTCTRHHSSPTPQKQPPPSRAWRSIVDGGPPAAPPRCAA